MKKLTFVLALLAAFTFSAKAQETFKPGAYLQLQGGVAYDFGEASFGKLLSPAAQAAVGYRFNDMFGARLSVTGWQAKNYTSGSAIQYKYQFVQPSIDFQFDLASLFNGWQAGRVFNPYWFLGGGVPVGLNNQEAVDLHRNGEKFSLLWEPTKVFWAARTGLGADIRINDWLAFNLELNANMYPDTFNSKKAINNPAGPDFRFNALAGLTIRLGARPRKVVAAPVVVPPVTKPAPVRDEPVVKDEPVKDEPAVVSTEPAIYRGADLNIFFDLGKAIIRDSEIATMNRLVGFLRTNPAALVKLDGYADRATGNPELNQNLSEQRVAAVRQYLVSRGIDPSRITTNAHGDKVQPFTGEQNRVVTCRIR